MPEFESQARLNCPDIRLREFLLKPANLPQISDPDLGLEILSAPETLSEGDDVEFRITAYGFKQRMKHRYVVVSEAEIVIEQIDGPAKAWRHSQRIQQNGDPQACCLLDHIRFQPPGGMLGFVMTEARILESLEQGMQSRYDALRELLEG